MGGNTIDSLLIEIGIDPKEVESGIARLVDTISRGFESLGEKLDKLIDAEGLAEKVEDAGDAAAEAVQEAGNTIVETSEEVAEKVAENSEKAAEAVEKNAKKAEKSVKDSGSRINKFLATGAKKLLGFLAPLAGAYSISKLFGNYFKEVETFNKKAKGFKDLKKRGYSKQDVETTKDFQSALMTLGNTIQDVANTFIRWALPGITDFLKGIKSAVDYLKKHDKLVKAFFIGLAAVITAVAIPAVVAFTAALLANPLTWVIGLVLALALVFEDLWVYLNGGKSALEGLWKAMGLGPDSLKTLEQAWEDFKTTLAETWEYLKKGAKEFFADFEGAIEPLKAALLKVGEMFKAIFEGDFVAAGEVAREAFESFLDAIEVIFDEVIKKIKAGLETLKNEALGIIGLGEDGVISKAQDAVGNAGADFLEGFTGAAKDRQARNASFEKQMAEAQAKLAEALKQRETLAGSPLVPGAALAAPVTNDTKIEFHQSNSIYTSDTNASLDGAASSGAQQIAKAMSNAVRQ